MQGIYKHLPQNIDVCRLCTVTAILLLQYMAHVMLFPTIKPLPRTSALYTVCVQCPM